MDNVRGPKAKEALSALREERKALIERAHTNIKAQNQRIKEIFGAFQDGAKTIPEISATTGIPTAEVLLYVATLRKYGLVGEGAKDGDYFKYDRLATKAGL